MGYKVAVVGATGNVGREMLDILAERNFPADEVAVPARADTLSINVDQAQIMHLPEKIATIVIGNPLIADATLQSGGHPGLSPRIWRHQFIGARPLRPGCDGKDRPGIGGGERRSRDAARGLNAPWTVAHPTASGGLRWATPPDTSTQRSRRAVSNCLPATAPGGSSDPQYADSCQWPSTRATSGFAPIAAQGTEADLSDATALGKMPACK